MSQWQQGHKDEARRLFAKTQPAIEQELQTPSLFGSRRATLEVLHKEAQSLIEPKEADEAVENVKPHPSAPTAGD
jgi:DNA polymerase III delta subunit